MNLQKFFSKLKLNTLIPQKAKLNSVLINNFLSSFGHKKFPTQKVYLCFSIVLISTLLKLSQIKTYYLNSQRFIFVFNKRERKKYKQNRFLRMGIFFFNQKKRK